MTKQELMNYSWSRDFTYRDLLHVAGMMTDVEVPTEEEYAKFSKQAYERMEQFYNDVRTEHERARQELGWGFVKENGIER